MDEWEDIAVGPPIASGAGDWEDVAIGPSLSAQQPEASFADRFKANIVAAANAANPFADEAAAGIRSILPGYQSYDAELAAIRGGEAEHAKANPYESGASSVIGALASAPFLPSAIGQRATLAGKLGQAGLEGAGYGALFGAGSAEDGNRLQAAGLGAAVGGALGPALTGALTFGSWLTSVPGKVGDTVRGLFRNADDVAAGKLAPAAEKILNVVDDPANPLAQYRTLAEATQDPYLAQLEQQITKSSSKANELLVDNRAARRAAHLDMLAGLSNAPKLSAEEGGVAFRQLVEPEAAASRQAVEDMFNSINPGGSIPVKDVAAAYNRKFGKIYEAGGAPGSLSGIKQELGDAAARTPARIEESAILDASGRNVLREIPAGPEAVKPFSYMHSLRQRAQDAWVSAKNVGDTRAADVANSLVRKVDDVIKQAGETGGVSKTTAAQFESAKKAFTEHARKYADGPIGIALRKMGEGNYQVPESSVVGMVFNGKGENTKKLLAAVPNTAEAMDGLRGLVRDKIFRDVTTNDGIISPGKFQTFLRKNGEGLTAVAKDGRRLLDSEHVEMLDRLAGDMAFLDPQSTHSVRGLAYQASLGQPTTAQALLMQDLAASATNLIPGGGIAKSIASGVLKAKAEEVNNILGRALFDKDFAKALVLKATPERVATIRTFLDFAGSAQTSAANLLPRVAGSSAGTLAAGALPQEKPGSRNESAPVGAPREQPPISQQAPVGKSNTSYTDSISPFYPLQAADNMAVFKPIVLQTIKAVERSEGKTSPKGAQGSYQLMPAMQKALGVKDPFNDKEAGEGAWTLITDEAKALGDWKLAFAAYNAGRPAVQRALKKTGGESWEDIAAAMPKETRDYVVRAEDVFAKLIQQMEA